TPDITATQPNTRYIWVDQNNVEQIQHPFVVADYNKDVAIDKAYSSTASQTIAPLNNGLTYTAENGKVVVSGGYTADVFKSQTDMYTTNTVVEADGSRYVTDNSNPLSIVGVNHADNKVIKKEYGQSVTEQEIIDVIKGQINVSGSFDASRQPQIAKLQGENTLIQYALKPGQTLPTSGENNEVKVIATLPSNGVDAEGNALPGETKELTVIVNFAEPTVDKTNLDKAINDGNKLSKDNAVTLADGTKVPVDKNDKDALDKALTDGQKVFDNPTATQDQVNEAQKAIDDAMKNIND
ncbi:hypothetical protein, partial [Ligilactobacillus hayakitensis]